LRCVMPPAVVVVNDEIGDVPEECFERRIGAGDKIGSHNNASLYYGLKSEPYGL